MTQNKTIQKIIITSKDLPPVTIARQISPTQDSIKIVQNRNGRYSTILMDTDNYADLAAALLEFGSVE
jgi:hypothetical protein